MDEVPAYVLFTSPDPLDWDLIWPTIQAAFAHVGVPVFEVTNRHDGKQATVPAHTKLLDEFPTTLTNFLSPQLPRLRIVMHVGDPATLFDLDDVDFDDEGQYQPVLTEGFVRGLEPPQRLLDGYQKFFADTGFVGWRRTQRFRPSPITCLVITAGGKSVFTGHSDGFVRWFDAATGAHAGLLAGPTAEVTAIGITPDGLYIVAGDRDGGLHRWFGSVHDRKFEIPGISIGAIAFTPDGRYVLAGTADGNLAVWDAEANVLVRQWTVSSSGAVYALAVSRDGTQVVTGGSSGRIRRWHLPSGEEVDSISGNGRSVRALAFTDSMLVSGGGDGTIRVWGLPDLHLVRAIETTYRVRTVAVHGSQIVFGGSGDLQRLSLTTGEPIGGPMGGPEADVFAVAVTPDGQQIISGGADGVLRRWDAHTGAPITGTVRSVEQLAEVVSDLESAPRTRSTSGRTCTPSPPSLPRCPPSRRCPLR